jgi:hypothetical protein
MKWIVLLIVAVCLINAAPDNKKTLSIVEHFEKELSHENSNHIVFSFLNLMKDLAIGNTAAVQIIPQNVTIKGIEP